MPIVFDASDVEPSAVSVTPSVLAELMAVLHVLAESGHHRDRVPELRRLLRAIPGDVAGQLRLFSPLWARFRLRALMPLAPGAGHDRGGFEAELRSFFALDSAAFFGMAAEAVAGGRLAPEQLPTVDEAAFLDHCRSKSEQREDLARRLLRDPDAFREHLGRTLVRAHATFFAELWREISPGLHADADRVGDLVRPGRVAEVLASLSPESHLFGARQQVVFDKLQSAVVEGAGRAFVLVPSVWTSPHVVVKYDADYAAVRVPIVVQYPVGDAAHAAPTLGLVQERLAVLADEPRLHLARHLVNESCTTSELSRRTGMTAPQVSRHLRRLKDVGLLVSRRDGRMVKHRLRSDLVYQLGHEFLTALTR